MIHHQTNFHQTHLDLAALIQRVKKTWTLRNNPENAAQHAPFSS